MSVYDNNTVTTNIATPGTLTQKEIHLYGSDRLGVYNVNVQMEVDSRNYTTMFGATAELITFTRGNKFFELKNHLGNVLVTVSDKRLVVNINCNPAFDRNCLPLPDGSYGVIATYYKADVITANDYYPFGMLMPGRKYSLGAGAYRYGFNGKENDKEVKGEGNQQDYGMRIYDPRLGKFLSVDPITDKYPELTPYQFASNTPIWAIDLDGLEGLVATGSSQPFSSDSRPIGMILTVPEATKVNKAIVDWASRNHQQGKQNYKIAEQARLTAIKQGRVDGDGISWLTKSAVYISPWWNSISSFSDANDGAVLLNGKNLDGSKATTVDYALAGAGIFIPFVSGSAIKNIFKGFSTSLDGYKYGGKVFKNAEQFEKGLVKAGTYEDKVGMVQSVLRDVAKTNNWKKAGDLSKKTGKEFYDLGNGTFGSIDKLHGHFEIFNQEGKTLSHQGSINIDGVKYKERNKLYDIKL